MMDNRNSIASISGKIKTKLDDFISGIPDLVKYEQESAGKLYRFIVSGFGRPAWESEDEVNYKMETAPILRDKQGGQLAILFSEIFALRDCACVIMEREYMENGKEGAELFKKEFKEKIIRLLECVKPERNFLEKLFFGNQTAEERVDINGIKRVREDINCQLQSLEEMFGCYELQEGGAE